MKLAPVALACVLALATEYVVGFRSGRLHALREWARAEADCMLEPVRAAANTTEDYDMTAKKKAAARDWPTVTFTPEKVSALREARLSAEREGKHEFMFEGHLFDVRFASYLEEYLSIVMARHRTQPVRRMQVAVPAKENT